MIQLVNLFTHNLLIPSLFTYPSSP